MVGFPIGLCFAWRHRRPHAVLPLAAVAAMLAVFLAGPLFGLPLIARYVRTPAVLLTLFYGLAVCGWRMLPARPTSAAAGLMVGMFAAALSLALIPWHAKHALRPRRPARLPGRYYRDLREPAARPRSAPRSSAAARSRRPTTA